MASWRVSERGGGGGKGWRLFCGEVEKFEVSGSVRDVGVCGGFLGPQGVSG